MTNLIRSGIAVMLTVTSFGAMAQTAQKPVFSHEKAVDAATYLARQKTFASECPFTDVNKEVLGRLEATTLPALGLTATELAKIAADARAASLELIKEPIVKDLSCPLLEAAFRRQTVQMPAAPGK
jgi:hypothetical protein